MTPFKFLTIIPTYTQTRNGYMDMVREAIKDCARLSADYTRYWKIFNEGNLTKSFTINDIRYHATFFVEVCIVVSYTRGEELIQDNRQYIFTTEEFIELTTEYDNI